MLKSENQKTIKYLNNLKAEWGMEDNNLLMQIAQLMQMTRIADALEDIHTELVQANAHLVGLDELAKCMQDPDGFCTQSYINGAVENYDT